jgi:hypothetical protein
MYIRHIARTAMNQAQLGLQRSLSFLYQQLSTILLSSYYFVESLTDHSLSSIMAAATAHSMDNPTQEDRNLPPPMLCAMAVRTLTSIMIVWSIL